ncbi:MAG: hypothetical protein WA485_12050 [Candidatus Sulfotelmatobacter sp.]
MRSIQYVGLLAVFALVFSLGAFAKDKDKDSGSFDLTQTARIGSTLLQPGHYKAEWTGPKDALQISVLDHGKTVATATGNLKELPSKAPYGAVTMRIHHNNTNQVDEIDFNNRTEALVVAGS